MKTTHKVLLDAQNVIGPLPPIWRSFGYDEINWTYTPRGKRVFAEIAKLSRSPYFIRCHHTLTSGNALSIPTKGSTNVCHRRDDGKIEYDFAVLDRVIDTFLTNNCKPIVELSFMPDALSEGTRPKPTYDYRGSDLCKFPPKDYRSWQNLIFETVRHCVEKYGEAEVAQWYWEVWNEPDTPCFFNGSLKDYLKLYDFAVAGAVNALSKIKIGGPALAHQPRFLDKFLKHCIDGRNFATGERGARLDFISLHAKGTGWPLTGQPFQMPSLQRIATQIASYKTVLRKYPQFRQTEILLDECDMAVGTNFGMYDFPQYEFHNNEYYPAFIIRMAKHLFDLINGDQLPVRLFTTWAFYYEGKRFFEGNRALFDNENIKRPIYNAFQMFEMLGDTRVQLQSAADASNVTPQIDGIATRDARGNLAICLWNFDEAGRRTGTQSIELEIRPGKDRANIERYQIDAEFSNAYAAWKRIGAPQDPTPEQIAQIKQKEDLQKVESQTAAPTSDGGLHYKFELPQPAVCLIKIT